jgi:acyl-CoA synthetase (AMP-forming)/AMP-acid ligase II
MVPPSIEFYSLTFALFKLGCVVVLIDPGMGVKNLGVCLAEAEPEAFIGVSKAHIARLLFRWARKTLRYHVTVGRRFLWSGWTLARVQQEGEKGDPLLAPTMPDETAAILFTSGSTGVAKGAIYTHGIFTAQVEMLRQIYGIQPGEIDLPTFPLFGLFGPALGMTCILPKMDATRPGHVDPRCILEPIHQYNATNLFGSPALLRRVAFSKEAQGVKLPTLRRIISAGAPVPANVLAEVTKLLPANVEVHTPYGATESLPVATIGSKEILNETSALTAQGKGICVGKPVAGMSVRILRITEDPIAMWNDELELPTKEIGEIVVSGPVVTRSYYNRPESTALHKIHDAGRGTTWHRMGDVGYFDEQGRLWFCGRKSQRVITANGTLFTIPCEGIFNVHSSVFRTALVALSRSVLPERTSGGGADLRSDSGFGGRPEVYPTNPVPARQAGPTLATPVLCVELHAVPLVKRSEEQIRRELLDLGAQHPHTKEIRHILFHPSFPVDIRHNAKIFREKLALWAAVQLKGRAI